MAGWISRTRKVLSTVMSSLADDLEQTVQELNDVIYRLGGTHSEGTSSSHPQTLPDNVFGNDSSHPEEQHSEKKHQMDPAVVTASPHQLDPAVVTASPHQLDPAVVTASPHQLDPAVVTAMPHQLDPGVVTARPHHQLTEHLKTTLTRQPETSGFPSALNSRLSKSSATLQNSEHNPSVPENIQLISKTTFPSMISLSSPCLINLPRTSPEPSDRTSLIISERDLRHPHLYCKSPESLKQTIKVKSQNVCPCHRRDSFKISQGMKHPGRVIRSQSSIIQDQGQSSIIQDQGQSSIIQDQGQSSIIQDQGQSPVKMDSIQSPAIEDNNCSFSQRSFMLILGQSPDKECGSPRSDSGLKDQEPGLLQLERKPDSHQLKRDHNSLLLKMEPGGHQFKNKPSNHQLEGELTSHRTEEASLTSMVVEHNTHFLSWASFRPFTRMLSFAFAQLANVVLLFSEHSQNVNSLTASVSLPATESKPHQVTRAEYPAATRDHEQIETYKLHFTEQDVQYLNIPQRTQSTESFEIIESSCFSDATQKDVLHQRVVSEYQTTPTQPLSSDGGFSNMLEFPLSHFSSDQRNFDSDALTQGPVSSTDLVSFDFRKLLTDGHFRVDKPVLSSFSQGSTGVGHSSSIDSDYEIVEETTLSHFLTGGNNNSGYCSGNHGSDRVDENDDDEDKDSSASFIILSDNDFNDEFIF